MSVSRDVIRSWIENWVETPATVSPSFLSFPSPARFRRFFLLLLDLKFDRSIDEGPFPPGKGQKRRRKDFQALESVMREVRFAVGVFVIPAPRD
jgi:hypothetical protein